MAQKLTKKEFDKKVSAMRETNERLRILHEIKTERDLYNPKTEREKSKSSTMFVIATISAIVIYTCMSLIIQACTGTEVSPTLTTHWYTFWTIEIVALTGIKISNVIKGDKHNSNNAVG